MSFSMIVYFSLTRKLTLREISIDQFLAHGLLIPECKNKRVIYINGKVNDKYITAIKDNTYFIYKKKESLNMI